MTDDLQQIRPLDDLVSEGDVVMLTTAADGMLSRPVTVAEIDGDSLAFLVSGATPWVQMLAESLPEAGAVVGVTRADPGTSEFVALGARAHVNGDRRRVEKLWTPLAKAFFSGPEDPDVCVLEVRVDSGEWWDGPSTGIGRLVALAASALTGNDMAGEVGEVDVRSASQRSGLSGS